MRAQHQEHSPSIARLRKEKPRRIGCERAGEGRVRAVVHNWGGFYFEVIYTFDCEDHRWYIRTDKPIPDIRWSKGPNDFERFVKTGNSIAPEMLECLDSKVMPSVAKWALENSDAIAGDGTIGEESNPVAWGYMLEEAIDSLLDWEERYRDLAGEYIANVPGNAYAVKECRRLAAELRRVAGVAWGCRAELRKLVAQFRPEREAA